MRAKFVTAVLSFVAAAALLSALDKSALAASVEEVALMKTTNRDKILVEGAKKEGKVNLLHRADCRSGGAAGKRCFRERISVFASRIFSRQFGASGAKGAHGISGEAL